MTLFIIVNSKNILKFLIELDAYARNQAASLEKQ